jgi:hypothetical protein
MKPLDTIATPRNRDVIDLAGANSIGIRRGPVLSAELKDEPDSATTLLYAIAGDGNIFQLAGTGDTEQLDFPADQQALQLAVATRTNALYALARTRMAQGATGSYALWRLEPQGWACVHTLSDCDARPVLGGSADGVWVAVADRLTCVVGDQVLYSEKLDFVPIGISEGSEGTLWLIGGSKRYGGAEVRRFDGESKRWFLLPPPAAAISLAAAPDGSAWGVSTKGELWRFSRDGAGTFRECGNDADCRRCFYKPDRSYVRAVTMGRDGNVWLLSGQADGQGFAIERLANLETRETHQPQPQLRAVVFVAGTR